MTNNRFYFRFCGNTKRTALFSAADDSFFRFFFIHSFLTRMNAGWAEPQKTLDQPINTAGQRLCCAVTRDFWPMPYDCAVCRGVSAEYFDHPRLVNRWRDCGPGAMLYLCDYITKALNVKLCRVSFLCRWGEPHSLDCPKRQSTRLFLLYHTSHHLSTPKSRMQRYDAVLQYFFLTFLVSHHWQNYISQFNFSDYYENQKNSLGTL